MSWIIDNLRARQARSYRHAPPASLLGEMDNRRTAGRSVTGLAAPVWTDEGHGVEGQRIHLLRISVDYVPPDQNRFEQFWMPEAAREIDRHIGPSNVRRARARHSKRGHGFC